MRCPSCKSDSGELVTMVPSETKRNLWVCPEVWHHAPVLLVDVGLMLEPPPLPKQPSPFRVPEPGGIRPVILNCAYPPCGMPLGEVDGNRKYHAECAVQMRTERSTRAKSLERAAKRLGLWSYDDPAFAAGGQS